MTEARPSDYWLSSTALYIQLNAVGDYNYIHANCASGSMVLCYMRGIDGLGYDNAHNYRRWTLKASPSVFHDNEERYVYIAIPINTSLTEAQIVFPSQRIDIYGCTADGTTIAPGGYYYIFTQGIITASVINGVQRPREWKTVIDTGTLASDEAIASGSDSSWWRWDWVTDTVTFLKEIASATFRKLTAHFASISQLSLGNHLINGVADENTPTDADDKVLVPKVADDMYISKKHADRTPYDLNVGGLHTAEAGAHFGDFVAGQFTGRGGAVDAAGNAEFESIISRSYLKVMELIYNRLNAQEGDTSFSDFGTIEEVFMQDDGSFVAQLRKRWDGDFTAFQPGDIIYGYVNNLEKGDVKEWYKAWAWIKGVDRETNRITIVKYPDAEVPSGVNRLMTAAMNITRWGNIIEPSAETYSNPDYSLVVGKRADGTYYNMRQRTFYISTADGNIVELTGVNKPILERGNYGTVLGVIPEGLLDPKIEELLNKDQPYLYARGIIVQDLIRIGYEGLTARTSNYRGYWDEATAKSPKNYYRSTTSVYDVVSYDGDLWQCVVARASEDAPSALNPSWVRMTDQSNLKVWAINPGASIVSVRSDGVVPATLDCTVTLNTAGNSPVVFDSSLDLHDEGARLLYSTDGLAWHDFVMGEAGPLELEDGTGYIETEDSGDGGGHITLGGDRIDTSTIGDRIYFELRAVEDNALLATAQVPIVKDGARGSFQSIVFIRTNTPPDTPMGGSYDFPIPTCEPQWTDGIPAGEEMLWASTRVFRDNMATGWSTPRAMTDTATYDVEFSDIDGDPGNPTDNPGNWHDPDKDKAGYDFTAMLWRAERHKKNGEWSGWTVVRIKGEKGDPGVSGDWVSYAFFKSDTQPDTPADTEHTIPAGWADAPDGSGRWWMSKATIDGTTGKPGQWSEPVQVTAEDGTPGSYTDYKYRVYSEDLTPLDVENTRHPTGWSDEPPQVGKGEALWMILAEIDHNDCLTGKWSRPVRISGEKGDDGGVIYLWTVTPNTNIVSVRKDTVVPSRLTATVTLNSSLGEPVMFDNGVDLYLAGAKLMFSVDGIDWRPFVMGVPQPLELEDGTDIIELEQSEDGSLVLSLGGDDIDTATIGDRIFFELRSVNDDAVLASTQVPVVRDGMDGDGRPGRDGMMVYPAGNYNPSVLYTATDETIPVVMYNDQYYRLRAGAFYRGDDETDIAEANRNPAYVVAHEPADTSRWILFDKFDSVFANILMANFGKLASAVFYGDWMISQQGKIGNEESDQYQHFRDGSFTPYFAVNFATGEMWGYKGTFKGAIEATSGSIGGLSISYNHIGVATGAKDEEGNELKGFSLYPTHIRFSDEFGHYASIGVNTLSGTSGIAAVGYFENLETSEFGYHTNYGIVINVANAANNIAVSARGNIVTDGFCGSHACRTLSLEADHYGYVTLDAGTWVIKCGGSGCYVILPTRSMVTDKCGIASGSPFAVRLTIISDASNSSTFRVTGYNTELKNNGSLFLNNESHPYRLDNDANRQTTGGLQMGRGDIAEFMLVFDGTTYNAYLLNNRS